MPQSFQDKVVLVTGGTSGIGLETAKLFAARGAKVVVSGRRREEGESAAKQIQLNGGVAHFVAADVSQGSDVSRLIEQVIARHGRLDAAFNNAGVEGTPFVSLENYVEETWDHVIGINLKGLFLSMKYQLPHLVASGGAMVNMASVAALQAAGSVRLTMQASTAWWG